MKRITLTFMALILLFSFCGCGQTSDPDIITPTAFYYHNNLDEKEEFNNVFVAEIREGALYQNDHISLLNNYLDGPESENLINPFPHGLEVVSLDTKKDTAYIVLSDQIAKINSIDFTMACSCLSLTLFELTQCNYVQISAENSLLSDQESILISRDTLMLADDTDLPTMN